MKKKVFIVIARLNQGGTAKYIYELYKGLKELNYEVVVAAGNVQKDETEDLLASRIPIIRIPRLERSLNPINDYIARKHIKKAIRKNNPDIVYSHTFKAGLLVRSLRLKQPIIHAQHGHSLNNPEFGKLSKLIWILIEKTLAQRTRYMVTVGRQVGLDLLRIGIGKDKQYVSIPPGVTPPKLLTREEALKKLKLSTDDRLRVVWLGRFVEVKNPLMVVSLSIKFPDVDFIMGGSGELSTQVLEEKRPNIYLVGWQDSALLLSAADVVINTSKSEGMSLSIIEAQQSGIPVVVTNVGSSSEIVVDGITGLLSNLNDNSFREKLELLLNNHDLRENMKQSARDNATKKFSVKLFIQNHIDLFSRSLNSHELDKEVNHP